MPTKYPTATTRAGQLRQVYEGRAEETFGGLKRAHLKQNKTGKIVSKKQSAAGKRAFARNGLARFSYRSY